MLSRTIKKYNKNNFNQITYSCYIETYIKKYYSINIKEYIFKKIYYTLVVE